MEKKRGTRGITLIALIITIIVMLILVAVTIQVTISGGIFSKAGEAVGKTKAAIENESNLDIDDLVHETITGITVEQVEDENPGELETKEGEENTFIISSIEDLLAFAHKVTSGEETYENKTVELKQSLDFGSNKSYVNPKSTDNEKYGYEDGKDLKTLLTTEEGFKPIGSVGGSPDNPLDGHVFKGTFDGKKNKIYSMKIEKNMKTETTTSIDIGMFTINQGTIKNLGLENVDIKVKTTSPGFIAIGGLVSANVNTIESCYVTGSLDITFTGYFGHCGGFSGENVGTIMNCYNKADIHISEDNSTPVAEPNSNNTFAVGGVTGATGKDSIMKNVYNMGDIYYNQSTDYSVVVSIAGVVSTNKGSLNGAYTTGKVTYRGPWLKFIFAGSSIGGRPGEGINNCYHLPNRLDINVQPNTINNTGVEKTEAEMKSADFVNLLNDGQADSPWKQDTDNINNGFPILSWQAE